MNLRKQEKSKGVVMFAFNTGATDYVRIAELSAKLVTKHTGLPVTIITTKTVEDQFENYRVDVQGNTVEWKNLGRYVAYELSPYDETILLDSDYLVFTDNLNKIFATDFDYKLWHFNRTPNESRNLTMGATSLPYVWATVVAFRKTERTRLFFNLIQRVQNNYNYYKLLYNIRDGNYRNDYAFTIANNIINGYNLAQDTSITGSMLTVDTPIERFEVAENKIVIKANPKAWVLPRTDLHVMDKVFLNSPQFEQLVNEQS